MAALIALVLLFLLVVWVVVPVWLIVSVQSLKEQNRRLASRMDAMEANLLSLRQSGVAAVVTEEPPLVQPGQAVPQQQPATPAEALPPEPTAPAPSATPPPTPEPPPLPLETFAAATGAGPEPAPPPSSQAPVRRAGPAIDWEQFMGAKLFAWLGGVALFLGVAYFLKYSFDNGLIPPEIRVALGFIFGAGMIVGGLKLPRDRYPVTAQTLAATGIVSLYAVTFACRSVYHFEFFGPAPTFLVMTLVTAAAFVLSVRMDAVVVAVLGILGGFLTPVLLSTGQDNPAGLFGYVALLDIGLASVALHRRWYYLLPLGAAGTFFMMAGWASHFYQPPKMPVAMTVGLAFSVLFFAIHAMSRRFDRAGRLVSLTSAAMPFTGFAFALLFLRGAETTAHPALFFGYVLAVDAVLLALSWFDDSMPRLHALGGSAAFVLLALWTAGHLTDATLPWALGGFLAFGAMHTAFPMLLERHHAAAAGGWWSQLFPPLTLLLLLGPVLKLDAAPLLLWPAILLVDLMAFGLALLTASLAAVAVVLVLTLFATALCLLRAPAELGVPFSLLVVIAGFAVFFCAGALWVSRRLAGRVHETDAGPLGGILGDARAQLPVFSSLLPFVLLVLASTRLDLPDPLPVFGLGSLLVALSLGLSVLFARGGDGSRSPEWLPGCALAGIAAVEYAWHARHFSPEAPLVAVPWYVGFHVLFAVFPFLFARRFAGTLGPWAVAALSGVIQFPLVHRAVRAGFPPDFMGALPALFVLPPLASLAVTVRTAAPGDPRRLDRLAWFGGVALFFITLVFPIQFAHQRQWLTIAWALEGAALLWLYHRVPHAGLRGVGFVLGVVAFARLALNPSVFSYHPRTGVPILNWYLYTYGAVAAALFASARLVVSPKSGVGARVLGVNAVPVFNTLATVLCFVLLNIEIADYFTPEGTRSLTFRFSGLFARDMAYTIGWSLFALALLAAGIWRRQRAARWASIALLSVSLLKLFFHDLARLEALYRIGTLFAVAIVAMIASFAYQRFLPASRENNPP